MTKLALTDLKPQEFTFTLSDHPEKSFTLKKFSLAEQIWCEQRFGRDKLKVIFTNGSMTDISEIAHHLLKDKTGFPTFMDFAGAIITVQDKVNVLEALLSTIGISRPIIDKLAKEMEPEKSQDPKTQAPAMPEKSTGDSSMTTSRLSMDTVLNGS